MDGNQESRILGILGSQKDMTLATLRADGYPQATSVSYVSDGLSIYFGCSPASQKAANIARHSKVSLAINCPYKVWSEIKGLSLGGDAERVTDRSEFEHIGKLFLEKFPEAANYAPQNAGELSLYRIVPKAISLLDYTQGFGHTELVLL